MMGLITVCAEQGKLKKIAAQPIEMVPINLMVVWRGLDTIEAP
jgi:hypothetical protein